MLTLFGATGYTGQLIARALDKRGLPFRIAGRSEAKLRALAATLPSHPAIVRAHIADRASLLTLFTDTRVLINCVGPFTDLGEAVVALAATRGVHYLDITNELMYVYRMRQYAALAQTTGAAIVPACGFEVAIADCAVAQMLKHHPGPVDDISIAYVLRGSGVSVGTRLSSLRILATGWLAYRNGEYVREVPGSKIETLTLRGKPFTAFNFPSSETATLPLHCAPRNIHTWMAISRRAAPLTARVFPLAAWLLQSPLGWLAAQVLRRMPLSPHEATRPHEAWSIKIALTQGAQIFERTLAGQDAYGLTGEIIAYAAAELLHSQPRAGVLAPAQALNAEAFLQWLVETQGVKGEAESSRQ